MTQNPTLSIQGIYEVCVGVSASLPQLLAQIQYWQQFGYRIGEVGELSAEVAIALYNVNSPLQSIRLYHQSADHGLLRLMAWAHPSNEGLNLSSMKLNGNRWATMLTSDILNLLNHAEEAANSGLPIRFTPAYWEVIYNKERKSQPFREPAIGVREMMMIQPLTRQVFFERFNYTMPEYGTINPQALFQTSQITHMGMVIQDDRKETLNFYEDVLGLLRSRDDVETSYDSSQAGRALFDLNPGERFWVTSFDDPRSSITDWQRARSGRLYIIRFPEAIEIPEAFERACPGCLGISLYTYRVTALEQWRDRICASSATQVTAIQLNEFGEASFSFIAPDGYYWTLVAADS
jgi:catechol 2,3-dioxygenase-like lactoylglutathione lyase family enzyme